MKILLGASTLALGLAAGTAQADCESWMASGSTSWIAECNGGVNPYPQPQEYGTRTEVYLDNGRVTRITEHLSSDEDDETYIYGDTYDELDELDDEDW